MFVKKFINLAVKAKLRLALGLVKQRKIDVESAGRHISRLLRVRKVSLVQVVSRIGFDVQLKGSRSVSKLAKRLWIQLA